MWVEPLILRKPGGGAGPCSTHVLAARQEMVSAVSRQLTKWEKLARLRLDFTVEGREETTRILDAFLGGSGNWPREYTTGHEKRGVE